MGFLKMSWRWGDRQKSIFSQVLVSCSTEQAEMREHLNLVYAEYLNCRGFLTTRIFTSNLCSCFAHYLRKNIYEKMCSVHYAFNHQTIWMINQSFSSLSFILSSFYSEMNLKCQLTLTSKASLQTLYVTLTKQCV